MGDSDRPSSTAVPDDELTDALFALLRLWVEQQVDGETALETALAKNENRLAKTGA